MCGVKKLTELYAVAHTSNMELVNIEAALYMYRWLETCISVLKVSIMNGGICYTAQNTLKNLIVAFTIVLQALNLNQSI